MNNNTPNSFNNGGAGNPSGNSNVSNPIIDHANEQLVGGQNKEGMGPSPMQGQSNVPKAPGVMQGASTVPTTPGVMQGSSTTPQPETQAPVVPGQTKSGINTYTMQYEKPGEEPELKQPTQSEPGPISIPNMGPKPADNNAPSQMNFPQPPKPESNLGGMPQMNNSIPEPPKQMGPTPVNNQNTPMNNNSLNQNINNNPNPGMNNIPNGGLNNNNPGMNNNLDQGLNNIPNQNIGQNQPMNNNQNIGQNQPMNNNQNMGQSVMMGNNQGSNVGLKPTPTQNAGLSQVGETEVNHQSIPSDISIEEPTKKKFPLSIREMALIGIAVVGIIVVIIMYT